MRGALLNPIRFYDSSALPDGLTIYPNNDNVPYGEPYQYGIATSPDAIRNHIGDMFLQFINPDNEVKSFDIYQRGSDGQWTAIDVVETVDISPVGWIGSQIHKITLTGLADGHYYLYESTTPIKSDIFCITSSESNNLVKIKYSNSFNDFGCIFDTNYFAAYFRGRILPGEPKIDIDSYEDDRSKPIKLKASPQRTATLSILGLNILYKDLIDHIFSCDTIEVNGVVYENMEAPSFDSSGGSDIGNSAIKLIQSTNDYYYGQ